MSNGESSKSLFYHFFLNARPHMTVPSPHVFIPLQEVAQHTAYCSVLYIISESILSAVAIEPISLNTVTRKGNELRTKWRKFQVFSGSFLNALPHVTVPSPHVFIPLQEVAQHTVYCSVLYIISESILIKLFQYQRLHKPTLHYTVI